MPDIIVIADDLTGAADACVAFVARGLSGAVMFDEGGEVRADGTAVRAFSTDTRAEPAEAAAARVRTIVAHGLRDGRTAWMFKKIDSTLRGNTGVEIQAAIDAAGGGLTIVAPAFPAMGRIVDRGTLRVSGRGALPPIDVLDRLALPEARIVARGALAAAIASGARTLICDAVDQADLEAIVETALAASGDANGRILWAGSAGLAHAIARHITRDIPHDTMRGAPRDSMSKVTPAPAAAPPMPSGQRESEPRRGQGVLARPRSIVFAIGSNHPATVAQQRHLLRTRPSIVRVALSETATIAHSLAEGRDLFVALPPTATEPSVARFADTIVSSDAGHPIAGLVLSGGDTAARLCGHLRAARIDLRGEISPGIPWGLLSLRGGQRWPLVLKAGGFGADAALADALVFLMENDERHV